LKIPHCRANRGTVIAGHRDSFFRPLRNVKVGDEILLDTPRRRLYYRVPSLGVVKSNELSVLNATADPTLTLITCYPFWVLGQAPDRFVVRATRIADHENFTIGEASRGDGEAASAITASANPSVRSNSLALNVGESHDDQFLVPQAIERLRLTYNARLVSHREVRAGGLLKFQPCDVAVEGIWATATCETASGSPDNVEPGIWTFNLMKAGGTWAIKSIGAR
jgi:LPXTG-site transpeptidase (sortase) family protein